MKSWWSCLASLRCGFKNHSSLSRRLVSLVRIQKNKDRWIIKKVSSGHRHFRRDLGENFLLIITLCARVENWFSKGTHDSLEIVAKCSWNDRAPPPKALPFVGKTKTSLPIIFRGRVEKREPNSSASSRGFRQVQNMSESIIAKCSARRGKKNVFRSESGHWTERMGKITDQV